MSLIYMRYLLLSQKVEPSPILGSDHLCFLEIRVIYQLIFFFSATPQRYHSFFRVFNHRQRNRKSHQSSNWYSIHYHWWVFLQIECNLDPRSSLTKCDLSSFFGIFSSTICTKFQHLKAFEELFPCLLE